MQFMNSSLDSLVKNLSELDFVCLSEEFSGKFLKLVKQNVCLYPQLLCYLQNMFETRFDTMN